MGAADSAETAAFEVIRVSGFGEDHFAGGEVDGVGCGYEAEDGESEEGWDVCVVH